MPVILWEFRQFQTTFTTHFHGLYKRVTILLTFLAYSLTLMHSVVPHHHNEEANTGHHHHGGGIHDHHHEDHDDDKDQKTVSHLFADAIHHPASEIFVPAPESKTIQKKNPAVYILIIQLSDLLSIELKRPDTWSTYQQKYYSSDQDAFFLLRAPPAA